MEIYRYEPIDVELKVFSGSTPIDPDSTPSAKLFSEDASPYGIEKDLQVSKVSDGVYKAPLSMVDVAEERSLRVEWTFLISGDAITQSHFYNVVVPYNRIDDLASVVPENATEDQIREASAYARYVIDSYCRQSFGLQYDEVSKMGSGSKVLTMSRPIVEVYHLYANQEPIYSFTDENNLVQIEVTPTRYGIEIVDTADPIFEEDFYTIRNFGTFQRDYKYSLKALFGWSYVPYPVQQAHKILVNEWFCKDSAWKRNYIESMKSADWQLKYDERVYGDTTGNSSADILLQNFRSIIMVVP